MHEPPSIGQLLRQLRLVAGRSQSEQAAVLSDFAGRAVTRTEVSRWESEARLPTPYWRHHLAASFDVSVEDVRRAVAVAKARRRQQAASSLASPVTTNTDDVSSVQLVQEITSTVAASAGAQVPDEVAALLAVNYALFAATTGGTAHGKETNDQLGDFMRRVVALMKRRGLFQLFGLTAGSTLASPAPDGLQAFASLNPDEQQHLVRSVAGPVRVNDKVIDHIDSILLYCKRQDNALGPQAVLDTVLAQRNLANVLLAECPDNLQSRLLATYSRLSSAAGWFLFALNDCTSALHYYEQARSAAHKAGNIELSIYTLADMSYIAAWHGKTHLGIDLAAAAQSLATKTDDVLLKVYVSDRAARTYAMDGQARACMTELEKVETGFSLSAGQVLPTSPVRFYDEGFIASAKSQCFLHLRQPRQAAARAHEAMALADKSMVRDYAFRTLHLGKAYIQAKEVDEAATVIASAAELTTQNRSVRLMTELHATRKAMQPWQDTQAVRTLDERLKTYGLA